MFEVTEKATGEVAEIYQDIRETMDMPFVNTIWRILRQKKVSPMGMVFLKQSMSPGRLRIMHRSFGVRWTFQVFHLFLFRHLIFWELVIRIDSISEFLDNEFWEFSK